MRHPHVAVASGNSVPSSSARPGVQGAGLEGVRVRRWIRSRGRRSPGLTHVRSPQTRQCAFWDRRRCLASGHAVSSRRHIRENAGERRYPGRAPFRRTGARLETGLEVKPAAAEMPTQPSVFAHTDYASLQDQSPGCRVPGSELGCICSSPCGRCAGRCNRSDCVHKGSRCTPRALFWANPNATPPRGCAPGIPAAAQCPRIAGWSEPRL